MIISFISVVPSHLSFDMSVSSFAGNFCWVRAGKAEVVEAKVEAEVEVEAEVIDAKVQV